MRTSAPESLASLLHRIHHMVEAEEGRRITQAAMAGRIGVSKRTYVEYLRGTNSPLAMRAIITLLAQLKDDELVTVIRNWVVEFGKDKGNGEA